ncbi:MAG: CdaR family protein [Chloroflexota bacterium]
MHYVDFLRRFATALFSNIATLVFSFVLAIIVWSAANQASDPIITRTLDLPIEKEGLLSDDGEVDLAGESVRITIQGPTSETNPLVARDFKAFIDQATLPFGESDVEVEVQQVVENLNIEILAREPQTITVEAIQVVSVEIPVSVSVIGDVARGYERGEPVVDPETILVTGPENEVNRLDEARINLFLESPREDYVVVRRPTWINADDQSVPLGNLETSASEVTVAIEVNQTEGVKVVPVVASWTGTPPSGYRLLAIDVEPQTALVSGSPILLDQTQSIETEIIDISGATESFEQRVPLNLPLGVILDEVQPVVVSVDIEPIVTSDVVRKEVEIRALGEGLTATVQTEEVTVFLFGPLPVLNSITADDVSVTLDLLDFSPGTHNIEPLVTVTAADVEFRSTQPEFVTVEINTLEEVEDLAGNLTDGSNSDPLAEPDDGETEEEEEPEPDP